MCSALVYINSGVARIFSGRGCEFLDPPCMLANLVGSKFSPFTPLAKPLVSGNIPGIGGNKLNLFPEIFLWDFF